MGRNMFKPPSLNSSGPIKDGAVQAASSSAASGANQQQTAAQAPIARRTAFRQPGLHAPAKGLRIFVSTTPVKRHGTNEDQASGAPASGGAVDAAMSMEEVPAAAHAPTFSLPGLKRPKRMAASWVPAAPPSPGVSPPHATASASLHAAARAQAGGEASSMATAPGVPPSSSSRSTALSIAQPSPLHGGPAAAALPPEGQVDDSAAVPELTSRSSMTSGTGELSRAAFQNDAGLPGATSTPLEHLKPFDPSEAMLPAGDVGTLPCASDLGIRLPMPRLQDILGGTSTAVVNEWCNDLMRRRARSNGVSFLSTQQ